MQEKPATMREKFMQNLIKNLSIDGHKAIHFMSKLIPLLRSQRETNLFFLASIKLYGINLQNKGYHKNILFLNNKNNNKIFFV